MDITESITRKIYIKNVPGLDPIEVFIDNISTGSGRVTITCLGDTWTAYWPAIGDVSVEEFFCDCDEHYIAKKMSSIDDEIYDIDKIKEQARKNQIECHRDDPWNDYDFMTDMYGTDMSEWHYSLPKMENPDYNYLTKIILAVQECFELIK